MKLKFEIQPAAKPTLDKDRAAKLVDPGFGRVFTDHMAIVRYDQANGWHGARIEARANFSIDPATAVLHYAQEIFEGLKAYKATTAAWICSARTPMPGASGIRPSAWP